MFRNDIQYSSVIGCQSGNTQDNVPVEMRLARQLSVLGNVKPVNTPPSGSGYRTGSSPFDLPTSVCQPGRPNVSIQAGNGGSSYRITRLANYGRPSTRFVRRSTFETSLATSQGDASIHTRLPRELLVSALPPRGQSSEAFAQTNSVNTCIPMAVLMAYKVTCVAKRNDLRRMLKQFSMGQYFSPYPKNWNTTQMCWWPDCLLKLTVACQQVIEFARCLPGFKDFQKEDRTLLLKGGVFQMALIRMSSFDGKGYAFYVQEYVADSMFCSDTAAERKLAAGISILLRELASMSLTQTEVGLYAAVALMCPNRDGLVDHSKIRRWRDLFWNSLMDEIRNTHPNYRFLPERLATCMNRLNCLAAQHISVASQFQLLAPLIVPPLYKELFVVNKEE